MEVLTSRHGGWWALAVLAPWTFTAPPAATPPSPSADGRSGFFFNFAPRILVDRR